MKHLKTAFWGYEKKSVYTYFSALTKKVNEELEEKNAIIADLRAQLKRRIAPTNAPSADDMIENAHKQAEIIVKNANASLLATKEKLKKEIKEEKIKLRLLQAEVAGLKNKAEEAAKKFTFELEPLLEETDN